MTEILNPRKAWLAKRRETLGASEVAAVLGYDRFHTALDVFASKLGAADESDTPAMRWGRKAEALVGEMYAEETGRPVITPDPYAIITHPDIPWLSATLDRRTLPSASHPAPESVVAEHGFSRVAAGPVPLELKVQHGERGEAWAVEPPTGYQMQLMIQLSVTSAPWGPICAAIGWPPKPVWYDLIRDDAFLAACMPKLEAFWMRVQRREPPEPTSHMDLAPLRRLYRDGNGETVALNRTLVLGHEPNPCGAVSLDRCELAFGLRDEEAVAAWSACHFVVGYDQEEVCELFCAKPQADHYEDPLDVIAEWDTARAAITAKGREADLLEAKLRARLGPATFGALANGEYLSRRLVKRKGYSVEPATYTVLRRERPRLKRR